MEQTKKLIDISVQLPGYYIVENNVPRKVTREAYEKHVAKNECCFLALGENKTEENCG